MQVSTCTHRRFRHKIHRLVTVTSELKERGGEVLWTTLFGLMALRVPVTNSKLIRICNLSRGDGRFDFESISVYAWLTCLSASSLFQQMGNGKDDFLLGESLAVTSLVFQ